MIETLALMIITSWWLAFTVPGFVIALRTLSWVQEQVLAGVKPWACDVCMTFWSLLLWSLVPVAVLGPQALFFVPPAYFGALWLLHRWQEPPEPPTLGFGGDL